MFLTFLRYVFYAVAISLLASLGIRRAHRINPTWLAQTNGRIGIPNWLSISRIAATVIATDLYLTQGFGAHSNIIASVILGSALITDAFDGFIARRTGQITKVGKYLDPLSDKIISYLAFISFFKLSKFNGFLI